MDYKILLHEKPVLTLLYLRDKSKEWYASLLAKHVDCTYPHMVKILKGFEDAGLVVSELRGRTRIAKLTETGEDIARDLEGLVNHMKKI